MCIAILGRVVARGESGETTIPAVVEVGATQVGVDLVMVPEAGEGDYVVMHSGYAIRVVSAAEAERTAALLGDPESR